MKHLIVFKCFHNGMAYFYRERMYIDKFIVIYIIFESRREEYIAIDP